MCAVRDRASRSQKGGVLRACVPSIVFVVEKGNGLRGGTMFYGT